MGMSLAEEFRLLNESELRAAGFLRLLHRAHSEGLLAELLRDAALLDREAGSLRQASTAQQAPQTQSTPMDFSKIDDDFAKEIIRAAEATLSGQVSVATSADQRASVMASVFAAAGAALIVGMATIAHQYPTAVVASGFVAGALFLIAAALCVKATMPVEFWLGGAEPHNWAADCAAGSPLKDSLAQQADHLQERITYNTAVIGRNARWFFWGAGIGVAAPFVGLAIFLLPHLYRVLS